MGPDGTAAGYEVTTEGGAATGLGAEELLIGPQLRRSPAERDLAQPALPAAVPARTATWVVGISTDLQVGRIGTCVDPCPLRRAAELRSAR